MSGTISLTEPETTTPQTPPPCGLRDYTVRKGTFTRGVPRTVPIKAKIDRSRSEGRLTQDPTGVKDST